MKHQTGLYIIAAFLSFALSSIWAAIDETTILPAIDLLCENHGTSSFDDNTDHGYDSLTGDKANRPKNSIQKDFPSSRNFRLPVRRTSNGSHAGLDYGDKAIHKKHHSLICITQSRHHAGINKPSHYLIRLRRFII